MHVMQLSNAKDITFCANKLFIDAFGLNTVMILFLKKTFCANTTTSFNN